MPNQWNLCSHCFSFEFSETHNGEVIIESNNNEGKHEYFI